MIKTRVTPGGAVKLLNDCLELDRDAVDDLISQRIDCNEDLSDHPTVQVRKIGKSYKVGTLGLLNGLFGIASDGTGAIAAVYDVECPNKCTAKAMAKLTIEDDCPACGRRLILGKLLKFEVIRTREKD